MSSPLSPSIGQPEHAGRASESNFPKIDYLNGFLKSVDSSSDHSYRNSRRIDIARLVVYRSLYSAPSFLKPFLSLSIDNIVKLARYNMTV